MTLNSIAIIAVGGALGAVCRYLFMSFFGAIFPNISGVYATSAVNIIGSFLMGVLIALLARFAGELGHEARLFFAIGILGSFTTFSAFSLDVVTMYERAQFTEAAIYIIISVIFSILALFAGLSLVKVML